jgi:Zn-dependent protease with chaperone function
MTTQFFQRQDTARTNTIWLVVLFVIAVLGMVAVTSGLGYFIGLSLEGSPSQQSPGADTEKMNPWLVALIVGVGTAVVILGGSLYQVTALRFGGGTHVAESVGGKQITSDTQDPSLRRLMNIVEEMAISSGTPVPPVYLLEESAINAFAAGYLPGDAVLGVTRGAVDNLNRDELQGVIAHEFSHILNGDMRMNIRMIGILHGILLLGLIGHILLRSFYVLGGRSRSSNDKGSAGIVMAMISAGLALIVIGAIGSFIGGLIKAAVSRQREYLADASAVQFTRNPSGIAGALKRIGGFSQHGRLAHPNAGIASHMYFAQGVYEGLTGLLATHPPLEKRILAIDPNWDRSLPEIASPGSSTAYSAKQSGRQRTVPVAAAGFAGSAAAPQRPGQYSADDGYAGEDEQFEGDEQEVSLPAMMAAADQIGAPETSHRQYTAALLKEIDPTITAAAHETYSSRALVFALLISDEPKVRDAQYAMLDQTISADVVLLTRKLAAKVAEIPGAARLPLIDMSLPMLRMMTAPQYATFAKAFEMMVRADNRLSIFEWTLSQVLVRNLRRQYVPIASTATLYHRLGKLSDELSLLLSILARVGHDGTTYNRRSAPPRRICPT